MRLNNINGRKSLSMSLLLTHAACLKNIRPPRSPACSWLCTLACVRGQRRWRCSGAHFNRTQGEQDIGDASERERARWMRTAMRALAHPDSRHHEPHAIHESLDVAVRWSGRAHDMLSALPCVRASPLASAACRAHRSTWSHNRHSRHAIDVRQLSSCGFVRWPGLGRSPRAPYKTTTSWFGYVSL